MANTTNYSQLLPTVGGSEGTWGTENNNLHILWDAELFKTIYKDGSRAFSAAQAFAAGTASAPGLTFTGDTNSGFYSIGADSIGVTLGGTLRATFATTGLTLTGALSATTGTFTGLVLTPASTTSSAGLRVPHGSAPTSPTNGDFWSTSSGVFFRVNGTTKQLDAAATGVWSTARSIAFSSGDVTGNTGTFDGSANVTGVALTIANDAVSNAKMANMAQATIKGRASGAGTGDPTDLTATQAAAIIQSLLDLSSMTMGTGSGATGEFKIGPLYIKGGSASVTPAQSGTTGEATVSFANAFPTGFITGGHIPELTSGALGSGNNYSAYIRGPTTAAMAIGLDQDGAGSPGAITCYWWAIGY